MTLSERNAVTVHLRWLALKERMQTSGCRLDQTADCGRVLVLSDKSISE